MFSEIKSLIENLINSHRDVAARLESIEQTVANMNVTINAADIEMIVGRLKEELEGKPADALPQSGVDAPTASSEPTAKNIEVQSE